MAYIRILFVAGKERKHTLRNEVEDAKKVKM